MKATVLLALLPALVTPHPHHQAHRHLHDLAQRGPAPVEAAVYVPGPVETVVVYELNGKQISEQDVRQGIANGTLIWGDDGNLSTSAAAKPTSTPTTIPQNTNQGKSPASSTNAQDPHASSSAVDKPASMSPEGPQHEPSPTSAPPSPPSSGGNAPCEDCDKEFPNGQLPCDTFPWGYGAIPLQQEGLGGWSGIQDPRNRGVAGYDNIWTANVGSCPNGECCSQGRFCSFGCPNPYLKMAWPKKQGATKQSVGGLYCNENGMLEMPDGSMAKTLCGKASNHFTVKVQNKLAKPVSFCRTDYPGTESMTVPLTVNPGETEELAAPDLSKYFWWNGKPTSAQYYVNSQDISESDACTWTDGQKPKGNWAPMVFGASWDDINMNMGFVSITSNYLTTDNLDYDISFAGEDDNVINPCSYKAGTAEVCDPSKHGCSNANDAGCTATVKYGTLTVVLSE